MNVVFFITGGPKNYAYQTKKGKTCCKVRGFTLNYRNSQALNYDCIKSLIFNLDPQQQIPLCNPHKITRDAKKRKIENKEEVKIYKIVYNKRVIQQDLTTLPYGF